MLNEAPPVLNSRCWRLVNDQLWMKRQDEPAGEIGEVIGDNREKQPHLDGPEPVTGQPGPVGRSALVEADDGPVCPRERGDDEPHPGKQFAEVMLDLGDHPPRPVRIVVQSGPAKLGEWITEHRNVVEDFKKIYGEDPPNPGALSISIDSDDTKSSAEAFVGPILFRKP